MAQSILATVFGKSEQNAELRQRLETFKAKVKSGRLVKFWNSSTELPGLVALNLLNAIRTYPAVGWIRANRAANEDVLNEINELREGNEELRKTLSDIAPRPALDDLAQLDESVTMRGEYRYAQYPHDWKSWSIETTWRKLFAYVAPYLAKHPNEDFVKSVLVRDLFADSDRASWGNGPRLNDQDFQTVGVQLRAAGLVRITYTQTTGGGMALFWSLTGPGEQLLLETRTVRTKTPGAKFG